MAQESSRWQRVAKGSPCDEKTGIVKWHTCQTLQNQCETSPKQAPQSNISKDRHPKGEIQIKICLRWTASPFNRFARKFKKLKIVPPSRRQFFWLSRIFKKNRKFQKTCLDVNSSPNVMRNRMSAEEMSAPHSSGMESVDFRKFGRRNLCAKLEATRASATRSLENYSPQLCNP